MDKFRRNLARRFPAETQEKILAASSTQATLEAMTVEDYVSFYVV